MTLKKSIKAVKATKSVKCVTPTKRTQSARSVTKPVKKIMPTGRSVDQVKPVQKSKGKLSDDSYDRGFNDGYAKGLEDCDVNESR